MVISKKPDFIILLDQASINLSPVTTKSNANQKYDKRQLPHFKLRVQATLGKHTKYLLLGFTVLKSNTFVYCYQ